MTIATVFKTGGDYTLADVIRLRKQVKRHIACPFVCLSDAEFEVDGVTVIPLESGLPGWWGKMQLFTLPGPVVTMDLDTVVVGNLDPLAEFATTLETSQLAMLSDFYHPEKPASGVMAWSGDMRVIWNKFTAKIAGRHGFHRHVDHYRLDCGGKTYRGDQDLIPELAPPIIRIQDHVSGIYSYKVNLKNRDLPEDARVVCFHGKPRPREINAGWVTL
jgi:hypothetical protein